MNDLHNAELKEIPPTSKEEYIVFGFGGWLYLFSIGLAFQFFMNLKTFYDSYLMMGTEDFKMITDPSNDYYNSLWYPTLIFECTIQIIAVFLISLIAYFCIKTHYYFKLLSIIYISFVFVVCTIDMLLMLNIQNGYTEEIFTSSELYNNFIRSISYAVIWIPYFLISKRVRNTYVKQ